MTELTDEPMDELENELSPTQEMPEDLSNLYLTGWPFKVVPDDSFARVWADRRNLKSRLDRLLYGWSRQADSTIHLMWADLGAGKTHTLRHIRYRLDQGGARALPLYSVMPRQMKSFVEVYQAVVATLDLASVAASFSDQHGRSARIMREAGLGLFPSIPDTAIALQQLAMGSESQKRLAAEWLRATRLYRKDQSDLGVTRNIQTADDAVAVLTGLVAVIAVSGKYSRIVLMLDECQRLGTFSSAVGSNIATGLQTWTDACPKHLSLIMSFGSGKQEYVKKLISPELYSRAQPQHLTLELLSQVEAVEFVSDLLLAFRAENSPSALFPFSQPMTEAVISAIVPDEGITPRRLMQGFNELLAEADFCISTAGTFDVDPSDAAHLVKEALAKSSAQVQ